MKFDYDVCFNFGNHKILSAECISDIIKYMAELGYDEKNIEKIEKRS